MYITGINVVNAQPATPQLQQQEQYTANMCNSKVVSGLQVTVHPIPIPSHQIVVSISGTGLVTANSGTYTFTN
jgi:hypothetical protein